MPEAHEIDLVAALERLVAGEATGDDLLRLRQAVAEGRITLTAGQGDLAKENIPASGGPAVVQSGGVHFGQSNQIHISGSAIGSLTLSLPSAAEALRLLDSLQPFRPEQLPSLEVLPEPGPLPPGSCLPFPRNAVFTGRVEDLKSLAKSLLYGPQADAKVTQSAADAFHNVVGITQAAAATGTGGVGKTQLAVEFCYRYGRFLHGAHWLHADQDMTAEIAACGATMGLQPWPEALPEQAAATLQAWGRGGTRLVVLDDVDEVEVVQEWLPKLSNARVLVTSRQSDWPPDLGIALFPLDSLPRAESLVLLRKLAPRLEKVPIDELDRVAERLGDLPLALDLAGRYLGDRRGLSPTGFLDELEQAGSTLAHSALRDWTRHNPTQHETNLAATFSLSWDRLGCFGGPQGCTPQRVLCAAGYCAANTPIPWEVFYRLEGAEDGLAQAEVDRAMGALEDGGLVKLTEAGALIHPLLAEFARLQDGAAEESTLPGLADTLGALTDQQDESILPEMIKPLRAHLETVAGQAEQNRLEQAGFLWNNLAWHLKMMADFAQAKACYERALRIDEAVFGADHAKIAIYLNDLGLVLYAQGDYSGAKAAFERALRIDEAARGFDHPSVGIRFNNLGLVLSEQGDLAGAKTAYEKALVISEKHNGPNHQSVATTVNNLGALSLNMGDYRGAEAAFTRALAIDEGAFGVEHPSVARDLNNLAYTLRMLGDYEGAKAANEQAIRIGESVFGLDHPEVAIYINNLGALLNFLGDHVGAQAAIERALRIYESAFGQDHPNIAITRHNLGLVFKALGDYPRALAEIEWALRSDEAAFGPKHLRVARDVNSLGEVLHALGDLDGAGVSFERALGIDEQAFGPDHPNVATDVNNLGRVFMALGDEAAAKAVFERALRIDEAAFGLEHPNVARDVNNLGEIMQERGDLDGARAAYQRALAIYEKSLPPDHPLIRQVRSNLESL